MDQTESSTATNDSMSESTIEGSVKLSVPNAGTDSMHVQVALATFDSNGNVTNAIPLAINMDGTYHLTNAQVANVVVMPPLNSNIDLSNITMTRTVIDDSTKDSNVETATATITTTLSVDEVADGVSGFGVHDATASFGSSISCFCYDCRDDKRCRCQ